MDLLSMRCAPLPPGAQPLTRREIRDLMKEVPEWSLDEGHLVLRLSCRDFADCVRKFGTIIEVAVQEGHYPDICISGSRHVDVLLYTYAIGGLSLNDFILASKITRQLLKGSADSAL